MNLHAIVSQRAARFPLSGLPTSLSPLPLLALAAFASPMIAQSPDAIHSAIASMEWRPIGPANMGGRVTAIEGVPGDPLTFWVGGADGGVFHTTNGGTTFEAQFTDQAVYSVGALTLAESDHNVLWLGSGEGDPRNSASYGNGVYRSTDGGTTWTYLGLEGTERIKRIAVDPTDADVAYVCAMGRAWGPNPERGVYRTTDGGQTWTKALFVNEDTGCSDIAMDMTNPRIMYAGMWTFRRRPWRFDDGGGETALYKTMDGGATWSKLTGRGMPTEPMARIGVHVARSSSNVVYMVTETPTKGTLFRSDDYGVTWRMVNDDRNINFRPFYYSDIRVDPNDPNTLYSLSGGLFKSIDGGENFDRIGRAVHGDHQSFWIDPLNSRHLLSGSDGGFQVSDDGGETFDVINNVTLSQFYQVAFDMQQPYYVCGGLQDNGTWCGPSRATHSEGILKDDWYAVSGGDGFYAVPSLTEPWIIYTDLQGGVFMVTDMRNGGTRRIHPYPNRIGSVGDAMLGHKYRFNWDSPIALSPHDPGTVYIGGNHVFKSNDYGHSWVALSPDLTTNDTTKQLSSGGPIYQDNTAAEFHTTILTIAESPVQAGVIWAGTDDGKVWVTQDGGGNWTDITGDIRGLPEFAWVAKIEASHFNAGTAYIAVDQHRMDDFRPYAFEVTEFGRRSRALGASLPQDDYVKVIRQDRRNPDLLFVGMERGLVASWDAGATWVDIRNGLPPVSVRDIQVHPRDNDLIVGTHGRGAYIMDDIGPLQDLRTAMAQPVFLFDVRPAIKWEGGSRDASLGQREFRAPNPPNGAYINYYVADKPSGRERIVITDSSGDTVRVLQVRDTTSGLHRAVWNLRYEGPKPVPGEQEGGGFFGGGAGGGGPEVVPGSYTVTLAIAGRTLQTAVEVQPDPNVDIPTAHYVAQRDAGLRLRDLISRVNAMIGTTNTVEKQIDGLGGALDAAHDGSNDALEAALKAAREAIVALRDDLQRPPPRMGYRQRPRLREELFSLMSSVTGVASQPTEAEMLRLSELEGETNAQQAALDALLSSKVAEINRLAGGLPRIVLP